MREPREYSSSQSRPFLLAYSSVTGTLKVKVLTQNVLPLPQNLALLDGVARPSTRPSSGASSRTTFLPKKPGLMERAGRTRPSCSARAWRGRGIRALTGNPTAARYIFSSVPWFDQRTPFMLVWISRVDARSVARLWFFYAQREISFPCLHVVAARPYTACLGDHIFFVTSWLRASRV